MKEKETDCELCGKYPSRVQLMSVCDDNVHSFHENICDVCYKKIMNLCKRIKNNYQKYVDKK